MAIRKEQPDRATRQGKQEAQTGGATNCGEEICILTGRVWILGSGVQQAVIAKEQSRARMR
jgi:hypothetical protein